jgi:hypothetical protein
MPLVRGYNELTLAPCHMIEKGFQNTERAHTVYVEHVVPGCVIYFSDRLIPPSADPCIIQEEVNWVPTNVCRSFPDAFAVRDIHGESAELLTRVR